MKKTLFIVTIFCMVLAFSTAIFASGTQTITVSSNVESTVELSAEVGPNCGRAVIELNGKKDYIDFFFPVTYSGQTFTVSEPVKDENGDVVSNAATPITFIGTADVTITPSNGLLGAQTNVVNISNDATVKTDNPLATEAAAPLISSITPIGATASSTLGGFPTSKLYDGIIGGDETGWINDGGTDAFNAPRWVAYEFSTPINAKRVVLYFGGGGTFNSPADYTIDVTNDLTNGPWTTVKTVVANLSSPNDWSLDYEGTYKYLRLHITKVNNDNYSRVLEMAVYAQTFDGNAYSYIVVPAANTSASSIFNNGVHDYGPDKLVDRKWADVETDAWVALNTTAETPNWACYDLGRQVMIGAAVVRHQPNWWEITVDYKIQGSNNNSTWTDLATVTNNINNVTVHEFTPAAYRYVRILITNSGSVGDGAVRLDEFELYTPVYNN